MKGTVRIFNRYWFVPAVISVVVEAGLLILASGGAYHLRGWIF